MSGVRVKVCGVTRLEDALLAERLGADALGFNFWRGSKRYCPPDVARRIIRALSPFVLPVGIFVDEPKERILRLVARTGIRAVQLHGQEPARACRGYDVPVLKAVAVTDERALAGLEGYPVAAFVLDTPTAGHGGSGRTFDWGVLARARPPRPFLLAGGLTPQNVRAAIRAARPDGVDVASGVESSPGLKDARKLARFIAAAKEA